MSLLFQPLNGMSAIDVVDITHSIPVETPQGFRTLAIGVLIDYLGVTTLPDSAALTETSNDHETRIASLETVDETSVSRLTSLETTIGNHGSRLDLLDTLGTRVEALESATSQGGNPVWTVVAVDTTMVSGVPYIVDASNGPIDMLLPAVLNVGDSFQVFTYGGDITILHNGHGIDGLTFGDDLGLAAGEAVTLTALNSSTVLITA